MKFDSHFIKGSTHQVCQDHAIVKSLPNRLIGVISDGCSIINYSDGTSKLHPCSDIASGIICQVAVNVMETLCKREEFKEVTHNFTELVSQKLSAIRLISGMDNIGDATLSLMTNNDNITCFVTIGDGIVFYEDDDYYTLVIREYSPNAPMYLSYLMTSERYKHYENNKVTLTKSKYRYNKNWEKVNENIQTINNKPFSLVNIDVARDIKKSAIFSDGITSVYTKTQRQQIQTHQVVKDLLNFKTLGGEFVKRRLSSFLKRNDIILADDISMSVFIKEDI